MEYAVIVACVVGALVAMSVYVKRAMQGRLRQSADELGEQYAPKNTTGISNIAVDSRSTTVTSNVNEKTMYDDCLKQPGMNDVKCREAADLNGNGQLDEDVFALRSKTTLDSENSNQSSTETVGPLEDSIY